VAPDGVPICNDTWARLIFTYSSCVLRYQDELIGRAGLYPGAQGSVQPLVGEAVNR